MDEKFSIMMRNLLLWEILINSEVSYHLENLDPTNHKEIDAESIYFTQHKVLCKFFTKIVYRLILHLQNRCRSNLISSTENLLQILAFISPKSALLVDKIVKKKQEQYRIKVFEVLWLKFGKNPVSIPINQNNTE